MSNGVKIKRIMDSSAVAARATTLMARLMLRRRKTQAQRKRRVMASISKEKACRAITAIVVV